MSEYRRRWSFSFAIGLALCFVCLAYIPHWKSYAPRIEQSMPTSPYLTPWTVLSVSVLAFALAIIALPFRASSPIQTIVSKTLGVAVFCFATIFLLEYTSGIRAPDLLVGRRHTLRFGERRRVDPFAGGVAIDTALHEFGDEPRVADRGATSFDVEQRVQPIIEQTVTPARRYGRLDRIVVVALALQFRGELRLGETALR